jgi:hypothetical protein
MKILKDGYQYTAKTPKVNMNTKDQNQNWYYGYCLKMIISEKPLDPIKAKGLVERMLTFHCRSVVNDNLFSIKEVTTNPPGDLEKQLLYTDLIDFRKSMLCYRLIHSMDYMPDIDTGLRNRDKELGGPLLRLFHDSKAFDEIKCALQKFLEQRKPTKQKTIGFALQSLIGKLLTIDNTSELAMGQIWSETINTIPGKYNQHKPDEFQTNEYGILYRNTLSQIIVDAFGAVRKRKNNGTVLIFDEEKIMELKKMYEYKANAKDAAPDIDNEPEKKVTDVLEDESEGSVSSEGSRVCGFIIE